MTLLLVKKVIILKEYTKFINIFFKKFAVILLDYLNINKYIKNIKLNKQPLYKPIYSLGLIELKTLKT